MRYSKKERLGVNITEQIFLEDFDWIFREQPIVDVGIDALVEQVEDGMPKGKFIALQIKYGEGNFNISYNKITYYMSNVHYEYWTNFDLPIVLTACLGHRRRTYWQKIDKKQIIRTGKKWKLEIPVGNVLNLRAKPHLTKLLLAKNGSSKILNIFRGENINESSIYTLFSKINMISDATESTIRFVTILKELQIKIIASGEKFHQHNLKGYNINSPQVKNTIKIFAKDITIGSRRMENEIFIFSEFFGEGFYAFEQAVILHFTITKDTINLKKNLKSLELVPSAIESALNGIESMRSNYENIPKDFIELKRARKSSLEVIDLIINEYTDAKVMSDKLIAQIKSITK